MNETASIEVRKLVLYGGAALSAIVVIWLAGHALVTFICGMLAARLIPHIPTLDQIRALANNRLSDEFDDLETPGEVVLLRDFRPGTSV